MFGFFKKFFKRDAERYKLQRKRLAEGDAAEKEKLAKDPDTHPEILYFLAKSDDPQTRKNAAANVATPVQAATLLANDPDVDVRLALAARLADLLPGLDEDRHSQLYAYAVQALSALAQDEVFKVRRSLSTALRDYAKAPPTVVARLAKDVEREIAEPILRYCIALADEDMLELLSGHPAPWVVSAIAARPEVSEEVSHAVVETNDAPGTAVLISNSGARFSMETLQKIVTRARHNPEWHKPLALRKELTVDMTRELAGFVSETILDVLKKRSDLDAATRKGVVAIVERRIAYVSGPNFSPEEKVERYVKEKRLTPEVVQDALAWQERDFAVLALAKLSGIPASTVNKMLGAGPKPIVALCWKAQLPVRMCVDVQRLAGRLQPRELLYPKGGTDYPLSPADIAWQLEFFGVKK